ncbi:MAG: hypothetical protein KJP23_13110 [Deltaproteobacteria bacterium]|nr:hypothetical protein [Deltaproteobacteria bacterium]
MKHYFTSFFAILLLFVVACTSQSDEFVDLSARIAKLNIKRFAYTLGEVLMEKQKETARRNAVDTASPGTYKFKDNNLFIVADKATDRVLILYEQYDPATKEKVRELVGNLFFDFGDPTVMAHDKTIYWAFDEKGKISEQQYRATKAKNQPLKTLATVKLNSSHKIMGHDGDIQNRSIYYIVSSEPLLKLIEKRNQ